ncbi:hypothetical protein BAE44_0011171 [Dichanthelium oligosanthes]|uniref:Uncharacterized protein n=1 Tax=Dichanthelium oligosanthes TaxID=888268 RepID=A0A1E5VRQ7_9POAL|nr:hypothetical protein BAE44_0011171 [Dichanthelium oligosanthes]
MASWRRLESSSSTPDASPARTTAASSYPPHARSLIPTVASRPPF